MSDSATDRFVAQSMVRLHRISGGDAEAETAIGQVTLKLWQAMKAGDVCVPLDTFTDQVVESLLTSPIAVQAAESASPTNAHPLVLSGRHLYTRRYWQAETSLAAKLVAMASEQLTQEGETPMPPLSETVSDKQRLAIRIALNRRLLILTGGPGTGKTFTLAAIVQSILARPGASRAGYAGIPDGTGTGAIAAPFSVAIAAPTGKATARLADAIMPAFADRADVLLQAMTLHRLLGMTGSTARTRTEQGLPFDLIVVDECSMVDTLMAHRLMQNLADDARLILAGDRDQLASVQAGAFFSALTTSEVPALQACRVVLDQNFRQLEAPEIVGWADALRSGALDADRLPGHGQQVRFEPGGIAALVDRMCLRLEPLVLQASETEPAALADLHAQFLAEQALAMLRTGPEGVDAINELVTRRLRLVSGFSPDARWYPGRLVVVRRNATHRELFNGDIGLCVALSSGDAGDGRTLRVAFPDGPDSVRLVLTSQMPLHSDAWALTVHQAQGSDFDSVLLMPAPPEHPLASREGLYTALTRARKSICIYGTEAMLVSAAANPAERVTGLPEAFARYHTGSSSNQ